MHDPKESVPLICHRCGAVLQPGEGNFYVVKIETYADPTPPRISPEDLTTDLQGEMSRLIKEMSDMSEQEMKDQVYRHLTLYLCGQCHAGWIEKPVG